MDTRLVFFCAAGNVELSMRGFDVNRAPSAGEAEEVAAAASSSPNSTVSSFQMEFSAGGGEGGALPVERACSRATLVVGDKLGVLPHTIRVSLEGELFAVDATNNNIVRITPPLSQCNSPRSSLYKVLRAGFDKNRVADSRARFGAAMDDKGNVYVADISNMAIRKITESGVTTIAGGKSNIAGYRDGPSEDAKFSNDFDVIYVGRTCSLLVVDRGNAALRQISLQQEDCQYQYTSVSTSGYLKLPSDTRKKKVDNRQEKSPAADTSLQHQCTDATSSLTPCMDYGSGSSDRPNSDCCDTVRNIRGTNPVCLCYAVQQTHNCSSPWSALGLKVERLLMLPGACNLDNSNASNCNARDPIEGYDYLSSLISFFTKFRNYCVSSSASEEKHLEEERAEKDKKRRVEALSVFSEMIETDHMMDSYWSDLISHNRPTKIEVEVHAPAQRKKRKTSRQTSALISVPVVQATEHIQIGIACPTMKQVLSSDRPIISVNAKIVDRCMPTALVLNFNKSSPLPFEVDLIRIFCRYGPIVEVATEVQQESNSVKLIFKRLTDAEMAFSSARKYGWFGPSLLSYHLRYLSSTPDTFADIQQSDNYAALPEHSNLETPDLEDDIRDNYAALPEHSNLETPDLEDDIRAFKNSFTNLKYSRVEIDEVRFEWAELMLDYI
ncbi:hypothetical protein ZIOFF_035660 [Zingiber officinale]|uniref:Bifunctional inhibitor/plant lipid transfer protein/seed storage helical domain-containing protein n=1 Tax=Zingiber officinale TaxID=94328 RepID=A0A8J5KXV6_ZINOF|nr:hypothetical protein ZIOFF_035660 [Zingiber officinale]